MLTRATPAQMLPKTLRSTVSSWKWFNTPLSSVDSCYCQVAGWRREASLGQLASGDAPVIVNASINSFKGFHYIALARIVLARRLRHLR